jgi:hypothetical protein
MCCRQGTTWQKLTQVLKVGTLLYLLYQVTMKALFKMPPGPWIARHPRPGPSSSWLSLQSQARPCRPTPPPQAEHCPWGAPPPPASPGRLCPRCAPWCLPLRSPVCVCERERERERERKRESKRGRTFEDVCWARLAGRWALSKELLQCQKRPTTVSKETYYSVKRDLLQCQKRPTTVSKETYYSVKRDLQCQKRPTTVSKETYYSAKRDLLQCQKRHTTVSSLAPCCVCVWVLF